MVITNPCDICDADFTVAGSGGSGGTAICPSTTVGSGEPTQAMLSEASAGDMYYDLNTGIGHLCQSSGDTGKQWTKVVGFGYQSVDTSQLVTAKDLVDLDLVAFNDMMKYLGVTYEGEPILDKYALRSDIDAEIKSLEDNLDAKSRDIVIDKMSTYMPREEAESRYLLRDGCGYADMLDAGDLYVAKTEFTADVYKALKADSETNFVLTNYSGVNGVYLESFLGLYLKADDLSDKLDTYVTDNGLVSKSYLESSYYLKGTVDSALAGKASVSDLSSLKDAVDANTSAIGAIDVSSYLKSDVAESTYVKRSEYAPGLTKDDVEDLGYAKVSTSLNDTVESDLLAPSVNAVKSYVTLKLQDIDVSAAVEEKLPSLAVEAGSAARLAELSGSGPYALANFTISSVTVGSSDTSAEFTLPAATSGISRNFALVIAIPSDWTGSTFSLTLTPASGETVSYFGGFSASFDMSGIAAGETVMYSFTEIMAGKFRVSRCLLDAVSVS